MSEKIIGIGGGVGPMAGVGLHRKIIENTNPGGADQGHIEVIHLSRSHDIGDRTKFLLGEIDENPAEGMFRTANAMEKAANTTNKQLIMGIPCNTFHTSKIFNRFLELLNQNDLHIKVLNMLKETAEFINSSFPDVKKIGLMSTTGTRQLGVYNEELEPLGFEITEVPNEMQQELHDSTYNEKWGIKAVSPVSDKARYNFFKYSRILKEQGAEVIILGCTEIPLALPGQQFDGIPLVDPVFVLARALIREVAGEKLRPVVEL